jgi:LacI family transcriptional regulator
MPRGEEMSKDAKRGEVARLAGVSESTVSRALRDSPLISARSKEKVREAAETLGYIPSRQAALFARKRTYTIGFVVPSYSSFPPFSRPYFPALLDGAVLGADALGYSITIVLDTVTSQTSDYHALVRSRTFDGLLFSVTKADFAPFLYLKESNIPFVLVNNYYEGLNSVDARPQPGMGKAFSHAAALGHREVGYITGDMVFRNAMDRLDTFKGLAAEHGMRTQIVEGNFSRTSGYQAAGTLLGAGKPPTLIMTSSDREALGVLQYCAEHGVRVPRDVSLIGYDNLQPAQDITPALSTVENPVSRTGWVAAQLLIDILNRRVAEPMAKWLDTDFVIRESTGAPPLGCAG